MNLLKQPNVKPDKVDYFTAQVNNQDTNTLNSPQIAINNSDEIQHPLSKNSILRTPPFLSQYLSPNSILRSKASTSSASGSFNTERRPSAITFQTESVFFDAVSEQQEKKEKKSLKTKTSRPCVITRISTAYTNKTATIPIDHVNFKQVHYLYEGVVLCAIVTKNQIKHDLHQTDKKSLQWKEYKAVLTYEGTLELYKICNCGQSLIKLATTHRSHKKPRHIIDLHPSHNNILFQQSVPHSKELPYTLSLLSDIDFSWSLSSPTSIFYFQSGSVTSSQQWYRYLYTCLPSSSKKPFPKTVSLVVPELSTSIELPLSELINEEDKNVELRKVLNSALVVLNRNETKPSNWNSLTVGLCWQSNFDKQIEWSILPQSNNIEYLIEPRLIEKTHELQLRFYTKEIPTIRKTPEPIEGYIMDASKSRKISKSNKLLYVSTMDHYLFLYKNNQPKSKRFCFVRKPKLQINFDPPKHRSPKYAVGVIDLLTIADIQDVTCETYEGQKDPEHLLYLDQKHIFQILNQPNEDWATSLKAIQNYYRDTSNKILKHGELFVKLADKTSAPFNKRLCVLTKDGDLSIFKTKKNGDKVTEFSLSLKDDSAYIHSGEESCKYINGLTEHQPPRLFENGEVIEDYQLNQCCFIIHFRSKQYVLLTRSQPQKNNWVQSICSFL